MSERYNHKVVERKWQKRWSDNKIFRVEKKDNKNMNGDKANRTNMKTNQKTKQSSMRSKEMKMTLTENWRDQWTLNKFGNELKGARQSKGKPNEWLGRATSSNCLFKFAATVCLSFCREVQVSVFQINFFWRHDNSWCGCSCENIWFTDLLVQWFTDSLIYWFTGSLIY